MVGVQVNFTDKKGYLRGVPKGRFFSPNNPVCKAITVSQEGFKGCLATVRSSNEQTYQSGEINLGLCHAGFSFLSSPIIVDKQYLGSVIVDGFLMEQTAQKQYK